MSNPFLAPGSVLAEREQRRREKFKVGVYAVLCTAAFFLMGMLIQGCRGNHLALTANPAGGSGSGLAATAQPAQGGK